MTKTKWIKLNYLTLLMNTTTMLRIQKWTGRLIIPGYVVISIGSSIWRRKGVTIVLDQPKEKSLTLCVGNCPKLHDVIYWRPQTRFLFFQCLSFNLQIRRKNWRLPDFSKETDIDTNKNLSFCCSLSKKMCFFSKLFVGKETVILNESFSKTVVSKMGKQYFKIT
jgi:hypothetical protein